MAEGDPPVVPTPVSELTEETLDGNGVFDVMMRAVDAHICNEYKQNRLRGPEYAQVYLGALSATLNESIKFLFQSQKQPHEVGILEAQKCKTEAEYEVLVEQKGKVIAERLLLEQKKITEAGQTAAAGVEADSIIGKQKALYTAQTDGFKRDQEQKAARIMTDTWKARRATDDGVVADATNKLDDPTIGSVINKMLSGIDIP